MYYSNYQVYLLIEDVVLHSTPHWTVSFGLCFSKVNDWVYYQQEVLKIFPGLPACVVPLMWINISNILR